jgi:hypothetical protein
MASKAIASYRYYLDIPPTSTAYAGRTAQIVLFDANNGYVGVINFLKTSTLPPTKEASGYKIYFQHSTYFRDFVDMLRHETPLYLMDGDVLGTSESEPVGEGE